ncbi:MAG: flavodoxin family protein [Tannerella sp.]
MARTLTVAVFYYTQTGQALAIARSLCAPLEAAGCRVVTREIRPVTAYPYPWSSEAFFQVFPESRLGIACTIEPVDLSGEVAEADLVLVVGQSWYLSLSTPLHAFFQSPEVRAYLHGRPVVFVNGCRNMWVMTQSETRRYLREIGARYVGFIELHDRAPNLVSVLTIIRWLFYGRKEATRLLPAAGVSQRDVADVDRFGLILLRTLYDGQWEQLQERLMREGAVTFIPHLYFIERNGYRMWGRWAHFVRRRGGAGDPRRQGRLRLFKAYLFFVLYAVSPFGLLFYWLTYPLRRATLKRAQREVCYELS